MEETKEYTLDLFEALKIVLDGGAVKGNDFANGIFMKLNTYGQIVTVDANRLYEESMLISLPGMKNQKFRKVSVFTIKELSK